MKKLLIGCSVLILISGLLFGGLSWYFARKPYGVFRLFIDSASATEQIFEKKGRWPTNFSEIEQQCKEDQSYFVEVEPAMKNAQMSANVSSKGDVCSIQFVGTYRGQPFIRTCTIKKVGDNFHWDLPGD